MSYNVCFWRFLLQTHNQNIAETKYNSIPFTCKNPKQEAKASMELNSITRLYSVCFIALPLVACFSPLALGPGWLFSQHVHILASRKVEMGKYQGLSKGILHKLNTQFPLKSCWAALSRITTLVWQTRSFQTGPLSGIFPYPHDCGFSTALLTSTCAASTCVPLPSEVKCCSPASGVTTVRSITFLDADLGLSGWEHSLLINSPKTLWGTFPTLTLQQGAGKSLSGSSFQ